MRASSASRRTCQRGPGASRGGERAGRGGSAFPSSGGRRRSPWRGSKRAIPRWRRSNLMITICQAGCRAALIAKAGVRPRRFSSSCRRAAGGIDVWRRRGARHGRVEPYRGRRAHLAPWRCRARRAPRSGEAVSTARPMIQITPRIRILVAVEPVDFRIGMLRGMAEQTLPMILADHTASGVRGVCGLLNLTASPPPTSSLRAGHAGNPSPPGHVRVRVARDRSLRACAGSRCSEKAVRLWCAPTEFFGGRSGWI